MRRTSPGEVLHEPVQDAVALLGVAELALVVVVDAREHAFEGGVRLLERGRRLVEHLAEPRGRLLDLRPAGALGDEELVLVRVLGVGPSLTSSSHSSSKRSERRFRKSSPKMKFL